ncbi:MAG: hypothetical protein U9R51_03305, partial [Actinomycetota bacterium]|nr:hypothetical protein [Actinomycetota bacterium]
MRSSLTSTAAGLTVGVIGLVLLLWLMESTSAEEPPPVPVIEADAPQAPTVTTPPPEPTVVTVDSPTPDLPGVGESATRVLYANGYAQSVAPDDVGEGLADDPLPCFRHVPLRVGSRDHG